MSNLDSIVAITVPILVVLGLMELIFVVHIISTRLAVRISVGKAVGEAIGEAISRIVASCKVESRTVVWSHGTVFVGLGFDHNAGDFLFGVFVGNLLVLFILLATRLDV